MSRVSSARLQINRILKTLGNQQMCALDLGVLNVKLREEPRVTSEDVWCIISYFVEEGLSASFGSYGFPMVSEGLSIAHLHSSQNCIIRGIASNDNSLAATCNFPQFRVCLFSAASCITLSRMLVRMLMRKCMNLLWNCIMKHLRALRSAAFYPPSLSSNLGACRYFQSVSDENVELNYVFLIETLDVGFIPEFVDGAGGLGSWMFSLELSPSAGEED